MARGKPTERFGGLLLVGRGGNEFLRSESYACPCLLVSLIAVALIRSRLEAHGSPPTRTANVAPLRIVWAFGLGARRSPFREKIRMPKRTCPVCGTVFTYSSVTEHKAFPFCSERCRLIDLGAWFAGDHQIVEEMQPHQIDEALHEMIDAADSGPSESAYDFAPDGYTYEDSEDDLGDDDDL